MRRHHGASLSWAIEAAPDGRRHMTLTLCGRVISTENGKLAGLDYRVALSEFITAKNYGGLCSAIHDRMRVLGAETDASSRKVYELLLQEVLPMAFLEARTQAAQLERTQPPPFNRD